MKNFNFLEKLWEHGRTLRRVGLVLVMCLTLGVTHAYAWNECYYVDGNVGWSSTSFPMGTSSTGQGSCFIHMTTDMYFKFRINGNPVGESTNKELTTGGDGVRLYRWDSGDPDAAIYKGDPGVVEVHADQATGDHDYSPWIWLTRPTVYIWHKWNNSDSEKGTYAMTDNEDGTYKYIGKFASGAKTTKIGPKSDCSTEGNVVKKWNSPTLYGSPTNGDRCIFEWASSGYRGYGGSTNNTGTLTITKLYSLSYDDNSATSGSVPTGVTDKKWNVTTTVAGNTGSLVKSGYIFVGWNTAADGTGTFYLPGSTFSPSAASTTLYAQWLTVHEPGLYETAAGSGGYGQTLTTSDARKYEVYQYAVSSSKVYVYAGTSTTSESAANCMLKYATASASGNALKAWMLHNGGVYGTSSESTHTKEFQANAYRLNLTAGSTHIIAVTGYDQFSIYAKDYAVTTAQIDIYINGVKSTANSSTSLTVRRYDLTPATTYIIRIEANGTSSNASNDVGFSLRVPAGECTSVSAPTGLSSTAQTKNSLTFGWTAASNASSYDVYLYSDAGCTSAVTPTEGKPYNVTTTSATVSGLTAGTTYYCKVQSKGDGETYCTSGGTTSAASGTTKTVHSITFNANGGTGSLSSMTNIEYGSSPTLTAIGSNITRSGWTFAGWNTNKYGTGTAYADQASVTVTANMTLYAQWEKTVYLKMGGGWPADNAWFAIYYFDSSDGTKNDWVAMTKAENCSDPAVYKATVNGSGYDALEFVRKNPSDLTLKSWDNKWNETENQAYSNLTSNNQLTITYMTGGTDNKSRGSWGTYSAPTFTISYAKGTPSASISGEKSSETKSCGVAFTLPSSAVFTRTGYTQTGWATSDGGPKAYNLGGSYTTEASQTFYPFWTPTTTTITLNPNTANHGVSGDGSASVNYDATAVTSISHTTGTPGYQVEGYYTTADDESETGVKILTATGAFCKNTTYTTNDATPKWKSTSSAITLYARYELMEACYTLTPSTSGTAPGTRDVISGSGSGGIMEVLDGQFAYTSYGLEFQNNGSSKAYVAMENNMKAGTVIMVTLVAPKTGERGLYLYNKAGSGKSEIAYFKFTSPSVGDEATYTYTVVADDGLKGTNAFQLWRKNDIDLKSIRVMNCDDAVTKLNVTHSLTNVTKTSGSVGTGVAIPGANYTAVFAASTGYDLPATITVTIGGASKTAGTHYWWNSSTGKLVIPGSQVTGAIAVTIAGVAKSYTVSFDVNGGTASPPDSKSVTYASAYGTLPSGMTHASKTFVGWYTDASSGTLVTAETTVSTASNHTLYAHYEDVYSVNVNFKCGSATVYPATSVNASATSLTPTITAPEIFGYTFVNWTGTNVTPASATSATTTITATAATTITANYNVVPTVYFKNNLGWDSVFVSFNCSFVDGKENVPSNNDKPYYAMTQLESTDIYYCVIPDTYTSGDYAGWAWNIAFDNTNYGKTATTTHTGSWSEFYGGECVGRGDFDPKATLYIPYNGDTETRNSATFYKTGCWMKYNSTESGYEVKMNTWVNDEHSDTLTVPLEAANAGGYEFSAKLNLRHPNYSYGFKLYKPYKKNTTDLWYTNTGTINASTETLPWHFWSGSSITATSQRCGLHTEALGDYIITVSFATGRPEVNVEYPASVGDWRLAYNDRVAWSGDAHDASWYLYSRVIKAKADATDTVSFYVSMKDGASAHVELQKCTAIDAGTGAETWTKQGDNLDISSITKTGIYNFKVTQNGSKVATAAYLGSYSGNFYIRTDASDGGWNNYIGSGKNIITYSEYAEENSGFTHYFMRYVTSGSNIKFCIANDNSECLTEYCVSDDYTNEYIEANGNVRFMWDHRTNAVSRAYISGSTNVSDRFLVLEGDTKLFDASGNALSISGLNANEMNFTDDQNWIYEATVKAQPKAKVKLTAKYNNNIQYFYGDDGSDPEDSVLLLDGTGTDKYKMRIVYDFKTNRLLRAFIPDGTISTNLAINADMMIIREHQGDAQQVQFSGSGKLSAVKTVYGAMKFNKYTVNGKSKAEGHAATGESQYQRDLFYISFPFDVKLSDAFGFGTYGQHWIIEYYDGKGRAKNGFWADSEPNWKFVMPAQRHDFTLKAYEGYILALELSEMAESSSIWDNGVEDVYVYFPSTDSVKNIQATSRSIEIKQDGYECTIGPRFAGGDDRRTKDSYWHCIGVPSFANYSSDLTDVEDGTTIDWTNSSMPYLYEWVPSNNTLRVTTTSTFSFKATWSYLVQYAGESIYWSAVNSTPASIVARERTAPKNAEFRIELQKAGEKADQTFVRLTQDENVTTGYDFNYDLSKEFNNRNANIYTMVTTVMEDGPSITEVAGNVQPMTEQTTVIPVGVKIATSGDYTFAIPEGTDGVGVTLIDNETGIRTSLSALDYTINLSAGTYDSRFVLEISPIKPVATGVEVLNGENGENGVRKVMIDGLLYIVKDGKMYDARGAVVK